MNYDEAYNYIFNEIEEDGDKLLELVADGNITEGINFIKQITNCSLNDAKLLWVEVKLQFGTKETNTFMTKSNLSPQQIAYNNQVAREWQNKPKCPTCGSTNVSKISATVKVADTVMFGIFGQKRKHQFKCLNCRYEW